MNRLPLVALAACALLADRALAEIHEVPQQHATIQEAVDAAGDGDTILIHGHVYAEAVLITGKSNLLVQAKGKVVIDPPGDGDGLTLDGCTDCTVEKIRVRDAVTGIHLIGAQGGSLLKCRVQDVSGTGIALQGCNGMTIDHCIVKDCGGVGIGLGPGGTPGCAACTLTKDKVFGAGGDAVYVNGEGNTIADCLAMEPAGTGYRTEGSPASADNIFTHDKCVRSLQHGFKIEGTGNTLTNDSDVQAAINSVSLISGSGTVVTGLHSTKSAGAGIGVVASVSGVSISDCKIKKPAANGISVIGDGPVVQHNKVTAPTVQGYVIGGDGGTWSGNSVTGAGVNGFLLLGSTNTLTKNKAKGSQGGFDLNDMSDGSNSVDASNHFGTVKTL